MREHVVLVAMVVNAETMKDAQEHLMGILPQPEQVQSEGSRYLDSWWIAMRERYDGSDNDSANFVESYPPGSRFYPY